MDDNHRLPNSSRNSLPNFDVIAAITPDLLTSTVTDCHASHRCKVNSQTRERTLPAIGKIAGLTSDMTAAELADIKIKQTGTLVPAGQAAPC